MKSTPTLLSQLNTVLTSELTSINQYFLHARMYKNWGYSALNSSEYKKSIKVEVSYTQDISLKTFVTVFAIVIAVVIVFVDVFIAQNNWQIQLLI